MFEKVFTAVTALFGVASLPKDAEGKSVLTSEMEQKITEKWGTKFLETFKADLSAAEAEGKDPAKNADLEKLQQDYVALKDKFAKALSDNEKLQESIEKMGKETVTDKPEEISMSGNQTNTVAFKPNMALLHNKVIQNYFYGDSSMQYSGNDTIFTQGLQDEFGKYVTGQRIEFFRELNMSLTVTNYMRTVVTDLLQWRASQAIITSVLQQFTNKWSPTGVTTFTPIVVQNYILKVNLPITPSDIIDQYIGYMYDENVTPDQMPIVKYITDVLLRPKLAEDLEKALATGEFVEKPVANDGDPGSDAMESMDGFMTILKKLKAKAGNKVTWLLDGVTLNRDNIVDQMEIAVDSVSLLYKRKKMLIHADPDLITLYQRAYRDKFPTTKNEDAGNLRVDFSNFTFAPVDGMIGTGVFFITPQENFIHLQSRNPNNAKMFMQVANYDVKIFMEFRKGTGFAMEEAIFAYLPPVAPIAAMEVEPVDEGL